MLNKKADFNDIKEMLYRLLGLSLILVGGYEVIINLIVFGVKTIDLPKIPMIELVWGFLLVIASLHALWNKDELVDFR